MDYFHSSTGVTETTCYVPFKYAGLKGIDIADFRAVGGGSKSDAWIQTCADILGLPLVRPKVTEAGALGAAIIAGVGSERFASYEAGVEAMVSLDRTFEPEPHRQRQYESQFEKYRELWPLMSDYLHGLASARDKG